MIECKNLIKKYNKATVVSNLSFHVKRGEVYGLLGANGAGKTTTIKMILGLTKIDSGEIKVPNGISIGYSPETPYFYPFLTGTEILAFYSKIQKIHKAEAKQQIEEILEKVGLTSSAHKKIKTYSKGMLQRLAVGQSLLGDPDLLILDEPTAGLDALSRLEIKNLILQLKREGKTILLNSHILNDVEKVADRAIILKEGIKLAEVDLQVKDEAINLEEIFIQAIGGMLDADHHHEYL